MKRPSAILLCLAGCAAPQPLVTLAGVPPPPRYAVAGDGPAADEVRRQLLASGRYADDAPTVIRAGYGVASRRAGACADPDPDDPRGCRAWHDVPARGWAPFAPPLRHHLTLALSGPAAARIQVVQPGDRSVALPALVSLALQQLPAAAAR